MAFSFQRFELGAFVEFHSKYHNEKQQHYRADIHSPCTSASQCSCSQHSDEHNLRVHSNARGACNGSSDIELQHIQITPSPQRNTKPRNSDGSYTDGLFLCSSIEKMHFTFSSGASPPLETSGSSDTSRGKVKHKMRAAPNGRESGYGTGRKSNAKAIVNSNANSPALARDSSLVVFEGNAHVATTCNNTATTTMTYV